ncbi:MAG: hypothetical protein Q7J64_00965, partial [Elusimicrobiota bacterium]|nr:hypothetical protein [Elusimicrobiota bacterium]
MKNNPSFAIATGLAAALILSAPSQAAPNRGSVKQEQIADRTAEEFRAVRKFIESQFAQDPKKKEAILANVARTEQNFNKNAKAILTKRRYGAWEFVHLGKQVTVVVTALKEVAEIEASYDDSHPAKV